jgi:radical SAM superfamily enzyme YgiQ (UPF0313 family)
MKREGLNVSTLNLNQREGTVRDIVEHTIREDNIDVVMTGGLSAEYCMLTILLEAVRAIDATIVTVVGGGIITADPETAMTAFGDSVDFGVIGEGELTAVELAHAMERDGDYGAVNGLIYGSSRATGTSPDSESGAFIRTAERTVIPDLDTIPWPDYEGFEMESYLAGVFGTTGFNGSNTLSMVTARSCPYGCTFCFHTVTRKYRKRSLDDFFNELDYYLAKYPVRQLHLVDDLFGLQFDRLKEFCERIKPYDLPWLGVFRLNQINPEMLALLKDSHCFNVGIGLESADNRILKSMQKRITIEQANESLRMIYESGISMAAGIIIGDPEETLETAHVSFQWWKDHPEYCFPMRLITPYPGTPIYHYAIREGMIEDPVQFLRDGCPQINISKMTDEEFQGFTKEVMEAAYRDIQTLSSYDLTNIDGGCVDIAGKCSKCGAANSWEKIRLFKITFFSCQDCGQQYFAPLDAVVRRNIDDNVLRLLEEDGKVAMWGMTMHANDIFAHSDVLRGDNVFPVDICSSKQSKDFFGKQVFAPNVIERERIRTVVICAPMHFGYIESQIEVNCRDVTRVIDVSDLISSDFTQSTRKPQDGDDTRHQHLDQSALTACAK